MLGLFRYILALLVTGCHYFPETIWWAGNYAVFCFYIISGYLMSVVLNEVYSARTDTLRYVINRALRIYPPYLATLALTVLAVRVFNGALSAPAGLDMEFQHLVAAPVGANQWLGNLSLAFFYDGPLAISQSWSLQVELFYYLAMVLVVRSRALTLAWLAGSILIALYMDWSGATYYERYMSIAGGSIAFSFGGALYYLLQVHRLKPWHMPVSIVLFLVHVFWARDIWAFGPDTNLLVIVASTSSFGLYGNLALGFYVLYAIVSSTQGRSGNTGFTRTLGDIAYAVFLLHWLVAFLVVSAGVSFADKAVFAPLSLLLLHIAALAMYFLVEKPVNELFRDRIRPGR